MRSRGNLFCVCYRPPSGDFKQFISFIDRFFAFASEYNLEFVIGGDLNVNTLAPTCQQKELCSITVSSGACNMITSPTRISLDGDSLLDVFITNINPTLITADVIHTCISDHHGIFMSVEKKTNFLKANLCKHAVFR